MNDFVYGNTAQFPPCGLSTAPAAAARHLRNEPDGTVTLRYLADAPQLPDSISAQPRLEDLYLWLFPEEMEEAK